MRSGSCCSTEVPRILGSFLHPIGPPARKRGAGGWLGRKPKHPPQRAGTVTIAGAAAQGRAGRSAAIRPDWPQPPARLGAQHRAGGPLRRGNDRPGVPGGRCTGPRGKKPPPPYRGVFWPEHRAAQITGEPPALRKAGAAPALARLGLAPGRR